MYFPLKFIKGRMYSCIEDKSEKFECDFLEIILF